MWGYIIGIIVQIIKVRQFISYYWLDIVEFIIVRISVCSHDIYIRFIMINITIMVG